MVYDCLPPGRRGRPPRDRRMDQSSSVPPESRTENKDLIFHEIPLGQDWWENIDHLGYQLPTSLTDLSSQLVNIEYIKKKKPESMVDFYNYTPLTIDDV